MNINPNREFSNSQRVLVRKHLEEGKSITPLEALKRYGCFRLSSVIFDLRHDGMNIRTDWKTLRNGKRIGEYSLVQ